MSEKGLNSPKRIKLEEIFERNRALIVIYLEMLKGHGIKLPESPKEVGKVFLRQVEEESGLRPNALADRPGKGPTNTAYVYVS